MPLVLDSTVVSQLCTPRDKAANQDLARWFAKLLRQAADQVVVVLPEIVDYEVRRGLLHLALKERRELGTATADLDRIGRLCRYLPLDTHRPDDARIGAALGRRTAARETDSGADPPRCRSNPRFPGSLGIWDNRHGQPATPRSIRTRDTLAGHRPERDRVMFTPPRPRTGRTSRPAAGARAAT